jgi:S1-C subfamily serine protease
VGVVAARTRRIERMGGVLGVTLGPKGKSKDGVPVVQVLPNGAAKAAGVREGDIISSIDGQAVTSRESLAKTLKARDPGELVTLKITRGEEALTIEVTLGHRSVIFDVFNRNQRMSGRTSKRRYGFSRVIHHDLPLHPRAMGGPAAALDGALLGVNIARSDRVTTFALPADLVREIVGKMIAEDGKTRKRGEEHEGRGAETD